MRKVEVSRRPSGDPAAPVDPADSVEPTNTAGTVGAADTVKAAESAESAEPEGRPTIPLPDAGLQSQRIQSMFFWVAPTLVVVILASLLGAAYLGGNVNPRKNLHGFPVAIVNADRGAGTIDGGRLDAGDDITAGLLEQIDGNDFDVTVMNGREAIDAMSKGELYGAIVIPENFSSRLNAWAIGTVVDNDVTAPEIRIVGNPRVGPGALAVMREFGHEVAPRVNESVGEKLIDRLEAAHAENMAGDTGDGDVALGGALRAAAAHPVNVVFEDFHPLPDGTGNGLSAFYWTLLIVLAGFTGAMVTSQIVDNRLGVIPLEVGPKIIRRNRPGLTRTATLVVKLGLSATQAFLVAAIYIAIGHYVGMPIGDAWALWAFTAAMIVAVGWVSHAINAVFGNAGLIINLVIFIILGLPSAGGTLPLEAVPEFFRQLGHIAPMHQIYVGSRSLLYLDGAWDSGVGQSAVYAGVSVLSAVAIGLVVMKWYDRVGHER